MEHRYIQRTLWYEELRDGRSQKIAVNETDLHTQTRSLVVLGEAGMGKTQLLIKLGLQPGHRYCTAKQLIARSRPQQLLTESAHTLVIDALDEAPAHQQHDAITEVLRKLDELDYPRFVLSCRVAEWHSATAISTIQEGDYTDPPLQLHLNPFTAAETLAFLSEKLGNERAAQVLEHFENLGLADWLGNPQTLDLISAIGVKKDLPQTRSQLFSRAVQELAVEHNPLKAAQQLPPTTLINAAGAACSALIICAQTHIVRKPSADLIDGEILLQTVQQLPDGTHIEQALNTRLFVAHGIDHFGYMHRRIGEYLAAQWLAQQATTERKRHRLLSSFQFHGLVPASLRGVYAWLTHTPQLADYVITFDPMAVIEYGETSDLPARQARLLLQALARLTEENPRQWQLRSFKVRCFAQTELQADVVHWITQKIPAMAWLRVLVIESLEATAMAKVLRQQLKLIVANADDIYIARSAAFQSLSSVLSLEESRSLLEELAELADEDSLRLSLDISQKQGFDKFQPRLLAEISLSYAMISSRTIGKFFHLEQDLPDSHLKGFLDVFTASIARLKDQQDYDSLYEIHNLACTLIAKAVDAQLPDAGQMLRWLSTLDNYHSGVSERQRLNTSILNAPLLRQSIHKTLLIEQSTKETLRSNWVRLSHHAPALQPSEADLIALLDSLPTDDERWKEFVLFTRHDVDNGAAIRQAAQRFAEGSASEQEWIDNLTMPHPKNQWEIKEEERALKHREKKYLERSKNIAWHEQRIDDVKSGHWEACWWAASIYLGRHADSRQNFSPENRIKHVLTDAIADAAHSGFEAHLRQAVISPSLDEISQGYAKKKEYRVSYIVISGLLERLRNSRGFGDLSNERILSSFLFLQSGHFHKHSGADTEALRSCINQELIERRLQEKALRLFYEPQLKANIEHIAGLHQILHEAAFTKISCVLAQEWLQQFPNLQSATESQLIDHLVSAHALDALKKIAEERVNPHPVAERHLAWEAVRLLTDFESSSKRLESQAIDAGLLWQLQDRSQLRHYSKHDRALVWSSAQCVWVFKNFRTLWPATGHPLGVSGGSHNLWDATEFLHSIAQQLATTITPEAISALHALRNAPSDGYSEFLQSLCAQQQRKQCEQEYVPQSLESLLSIANDAAPQSIQDLQAWVLEELRTVQAKIRANDVDSWRGFYADDHTPYGEERCRDHLLELLRQGSKEVVYTPETHVAADKEVDITCSVGALRMPIEIKGQWHKEVWTAADTQLDRLYTTDWQTQDHGIYLVLWFGDQQRGKALKTLGKGHPTPRTADEMQEALTERSLAAQSGRVAIVVIDLTQSSATQPSKVTTQPKHKSATQL